MKKIIKKWVGVILCISMLSGLLPVMAEDTIEYFFDNENSTQFTAYADAQTTATFLTSTYGGVSLGTLKNHSYTNIKGSFGKFTINGIPNGTYEIYYYFSAQHDNNATNMVIVATDSNGKSVAEHYNPKEISSGTWQKIGEKHVIDERGGFLIAENTGVGNIRIDAIKLVPTDPDYPKPAISNLQIKGSYKPGAVLSGVYQYSHEGNIPEGNSIKEWYRAEGEVMGVDSVKVGEGDTYTLTSADIGKYIRLEVIPVADTEDVRMKIGEKRDTTIGPIFAVDEKPIIRKIILSGDTAVGYELSASYEYYDKNFDLENGSTYQWKSSSSENGTYTDIPNAGGTCSADQPIKYTLKSSDLGKYIKIFITPKNNLIGNTAPSYALGPITATSQILPPMAMDPVIINAGTADRPMTAGYRFVQAKNLAEGESMIQWYVSDTKTGTYTQIPNASDKDYQPDQSKIGKYIRFSVTPILAESGTQGNMVYSDSVQIKWKLNFYDEFDYEAPNGTDSKFTAKWRSQNGPSGHILSGRYPKNIEVSDGFLKLKQFKEPIPIREQNWTSGSCWTIQKFTTGYFETRYKYAPTTGLNQSFWLHGGGYEIDINEGHYPNEINSNFHHNGVADQQKYYPPYIDNLSDDFHVYAMDRTNQQIIFYMDGVEYRREENKFPESVQMPVYFSVAVMEWAGEVTDAIDGTIMEVDYFRHYNTYDGIDSVNRDGLLEEIQRSQVALDSATPGTDIFCYPQENINNLQQAVANAQILAEQSGVTQSMINEGLSVLKNSYNAFAKSMKKTATLTDGQQLVIPNNFEAMVSIAKSGLNTDAYLLVKQGIPLANDIVVNTSINIYDKEQTVSVRFYQGTVFAGTPDSSGYIKIPIPKNADAISATVNGTKSGILKMDNIGISSAFKISLPTAYKCTVGYLQGNSLIEVKSTVSQSNYTTAQLQVPQGQMMLGANEVSDKVIWSKTFATVIMYLESGVTPPGGSGGGGGGGGGGSIETPTPSPSISPSPTPSPDGSPSPSIQPSTSPAPTIEFQDVTNHWAENEVKQLATDGIINGKTETEFMPDDTVTRAEFISIIVRALELSNRQTESVFEDINADDWYYDSILAALDAGIISADTTFRANDFITREEMTKIMVNALMLYKGTTQLEKASLEQFSDLDKISPWAVGYAKMAVYAGLINGISENLFEPLQNATRAQATVLIYRLLYNS